MDIDEQLRFLLNRSVRRQIELDRALGQLRAMRPPPRDVDNSFGARIEPLRARNEELMAKVRETMALLGRVARGGTEAR